MQPDGVAGLLDDFAKKKLPPLKTLCFTTTRKGVSSCAVENPPLLMPAGLAKQLFRRRQTLYVAELNAATRAALALSFTWQPAAPIVSRCYRVHLQESVSLGEFLKLTAFTKFGSYDQSL